MFDAEAPYSALPKEANDEKEVEDSRLSAKSQKLGDNALYTPYDALHQLQNINALGDAIEALRANFVYKPVVDWMLSVFQWMSSAPEDLFKKMQRNEQLDEKGILGYDECQALIEAPAADAVISRSSDLEALLAELEITVLREDSSDALDYNPSLNPIVLLAEPIITFLREEGNKTADFMDKIRSFLQTIHSTDIPKSILWLKERMLEWDLYVIKPDESLLAETQSALVRLECSLKDDRLMSNKRPIAKISTTNSKAKNFQARKGRNTSAVDNEVSSSFVFTEPTEELSDASSDTDGFVVFDLSM